MIENIGAYSQVDYDRGYKQGRADALNEFINDIDAHLYSYEKELVIGWMKSRAEELKEHTNERV